MMKNKKKSWKEIFDIFSVYHESRGQTRGSFFWKVYICTDRFKSFNRILWDYFFEEIESLYRSKIYLCESMLLHISIDIRFILLCFKINFVNMRILCRKIKCPTSRDHENICTILGQLYKFCEFVRTDIEILYFSKIS